MAILDMVCWPQIPREARGALSPDLLCLGSNLKSLQGARAVDSQGGAVSHELQQQLWSGDLYSVATKGLLLF